MIGVEPARRPAQTWTAGLERLKARQRPTPGGRLVQGVLRAATAAYSLALRLAVRLPRRPVPDRVEIVVTGGFPSPNWVLSHVLPLTRAARCARVVVVTTQPMPPVPRLHAIHPPRWAVRRLGETAARLLTFAVAVAVRRPDIAGGFHLLVNGLAAALVARLVGGRSLYFCGGGPTEVLGGGAFGENRVFSRLPEGDVVIERRLLAATRTFDVMVTMGNRAADFFEQRIARRPQVIPGGIDAERFAPISPAGDELILVGRLVPVKQVDLFLQVVERVRRNVPHVRARIVGDGPLRGDLERVAAELGLADAVVFAGQCERVETELRRGGIFVLTSASEGVSLALMEAMMCGLPAVVPDVGDLRDVVQDGVNGFVVTSPDAGAFADRITALLRDRALRTRFAAAARETAMTHAIEAVGVRWDEILGTLADEAPGR